MEKNIKRVLTAPESFDEIPKTTYCMFLGGSIEMNKAEKWQQRVIDDLSSKFPQLTFLNPRRDNWDSSWVQSIDNPNFFEQVNWEHDAIMSSDIVLLYFQPGTMSPISLLELGLVAESYSTVIVCCPEGFWRKGNVDFIAKAYNMIQIDSLDQLEDAVVEALDEIVGE